MFPELICLAPVHEGFGGFSAADAGFGNAFLIKGHAPARCRCVFLDLVFTGLVSAPHGFDKTGLLVDVFHELLVICSRVGMGIPVCPRTL